MRGVDYRTVHTYTLLICKPLSSAIMFSQALMRVGRGSDKCRRLVFDEAYRLSHKDTSL